MKKSYKEKLNVIGTNDNKLNKETDSTAEGRRKIDYLKFILMR